MTEKEFFDMNLKPGDPIEIFFKDGNSSRIARLYSDRIIPEIPERRRYPTDEVVPAIPARISVFRDNGDVSAGDSVELSRIEKISRYKSN